MSALLPKADICGAITNVRFVPIADIPPFDVKGVAIPVAVSAYPSEIYTAPRSWAEKAYLDSFITTSFPKALTSREQPQFYSEEVRAGFRPLHKPT